MKRQFRLLLGTAILLAGMNSARAGNFLLQNFTTNEEAAYGLSNSSGVLVSGSITGNLEVGYFTVSNAQLESDWASGNLAAIDSSFVEFGTAQSMQNYGPDYPGIFQCDPNVADSDPFAGQYIYLFASTGSNFASTSAQYLIYQFNVQYTDEPFVSAECLLGTTVGTLLVGGYDNYTYDYGLGDGAEPEFNTVALPAPVPEPGGSSYMLMSLGLGAAMLLSRRMQRISG